MTQPVTTQTTYKQCRICQKEIKQDAILKCSRCRHAIYCGRDCQKKDWSSHKLACIDTTKPYTDENEGIRKQFSDKDSHVKETQQMILEGASHLDPNQSIVVVCGAQFYNDKFVEPLPQLLEKCKKLILVDVDPKTLETLHKMLGNSQKVSTVVLDLTSSLKDLHTFYESTTSCSQSEFTEKMNAFLEKVIQDTPQKAVRLPGILAENESADYVISSLVGSVLAVRLKEALQVHFMKRFNTHIRNYFTDKKSKESEHAETFKKCQDSLVTRHVENLCALAGKEGKIYLSDTYSFDTMGMKAPLVEYSTISKIMDQLIERNSSSPFTQKKWKWIASSRFTYDVTAILS